MVKRKEKACKNCNTTSFIFGRGLCSKCYRKQLKPVKRGNKNAKKNHDYYKRAWDSHENKVCEECGIGLVSYSPAYISHVITKGANISLAYDISNHLLLCLNCHHRYEFGDRKTMRIHEKAEQIKLSLMNKNK